MIRVREEWKIVLLLIFTGILRLYGLGYSEFHGDEVMITGRSVALCKVISAPVNLGILLVHIHPPVEIIFPVPFLLSLGVTEFTARLPFALAGIASVYLSYRVGNMLYSKRVGLISATLLCFCGFHIMFSRIVMATSIELMFVLLTVFFLTQATDDSHDTSGLSWVLFGINLGLCLLTQYHTLLLLPSIVYFLRTDYGNDWWKKDGVRRAIKTIFMVSAPFYLVYFSAPLFFPQIGSTLGANYIFQRGLGETGIHITYYIRSLINYCSVYYLLLVATGLLLSLRFFDDLRVQFCWIWFLSFLIPFLFFIRAPVVVYIMDGVPPMLILASIGLHSLISRDITISKRRWGKVITLSILSSVILIATLHIYNYTIQPGAVQSYPLSITYQIEGAHYRPYKTGWKAAGWFVRENSSPSDLYVSDGEGFVTRYYTNRRYLCKIDRFFTCIDSSGWYRVKFVILSASSLDDLPEIWRYVKDHYFLAAIVRQRSLDSIFIYSTNPILDQYLVLLPETIDGLFDAKYGKSPGTILSIYV